MTVKIDGIEYLEWQEALQFLQSKGWRLSQATFFRRVRDKTIPSQENPLNKKARLYSKTDLENLSVTPQS